MSSTTRHRAYAWEDQSPTVTAGGTHDGLAILQAIGREELPLPPALRTLDITPVEAEPGRVTFTLVPSEFHLNPFGLVHGGVLAALIDTAMGCAVHSLLPVGAGYVTSELNVRYLRAARVATGPLHLHRGGGQARTEEHGRPGPCHRRLGARGRHRWLYLSGERRRDRRRRRVSLAA